MSMKSWLVLLIGGLALLPTAERAVAAEPKLDPKVLEFFEKEVRPLLVARCYKCHSAEGKQRGGLVLDSKAGWQRGGDSGPALKPGDPDRSLLIKAVRHQEESMKMPPTDRLSDREIDVLVRWVQMGALDPRDGPAAVVVQRGIDIEEGRKHWAFQPPRPPAMPLVRDAAWCRSDIDCFLRARQEKAGVRPVRDADAYALVRRATFDLTGLPPTPEEVEAFVSDQSPEAFAKLVDRLLASLHFGERWGRHWLDVARFAESGGPNDLLFIDAWRYRDYVTRSFNRDTPYDRFVIEQLAGDLLPHQSPEQRDEQAIATGFLALGQYDYDKYREEDRLEQIDEQIDVTSKALLGLTVSCARCHDHKYDPIPTTDYYALAGIFSSTEIRKTVVYTKGKHTLVRVGVGLPLQGYRQEPFDEFARLQEDLYGGRNAVVRLGWDYNKLLDAVKKAPEPREAARLKADADRIKQEMDRRVAASQKAVERLRELPSLPPTALGVIDGKPHDQTVRVRGEADNKGPIVPRGFLRVITRDQPMLAPKQSGRLELARWIASRDNPLTARVMVNRVWLHLFGQGLVPSGDNFGLNGERPSHPELLDWLAIRFVERGWSVKALVREIMLSHTYQLSTARDATAEQSDGDNRLLWRANRRRLEAEAIRDSILAFSGQLDRVPHERSLIAEIGVGAMRFEKDRVVFDSGKRSIYLPQPRGKTAEVLALFDGADNRVVVGQREVTTVPSQALFLLNSPFALDHARRAAQRLLADNDLSDADRIDRAFRLALGRPAMPADLETARRFFRNHESAAQAERGEAKSAAPWTKAQAKKAKAAPKPPTPGPSDTPQLRAWADFCQLLMASSEFRYVH